VEILSEAWIDIDLDAVVNNYHEIVRHLSLEAKVIAVVKADGYGLGAVQVARVLVEHGCKAFAVTTIDEGLNLRKQGIMALILVLGPVPASRMEEAIQAQLQLTLSDLDMLRNCERAASRLKKEVRIHLKIETGMGRMGFFKEDLESLSESLRNSPHIKPVGIYTHFARAAQRDKDYSKAQYEHFQGCVEKLESLGVSGLWRHVCNSAAFLDYPEWHLDFVRIGTLLMGHFPSSGFAGRLNLRDPWVAKARIVHLRWVPRGTFVGYQSIYRTKSETQLAVIPVGYSDGFGVEPRFIPQGFWDFIKILIKNLLALFGFYVGQEKVSLKGQTIRVAGKIGMQLTVLDIGKVPCQVGDEVVFPLRRTLANPRLMRHYWKDKRLISNRVVEEGFSYNHPEYAYVTSE
jgi:alanine racemase